MSTFRELLRKIYYKRYIKIKIIDYYKRKSDITEQEREVLDFLRRNSCHTYPYEFTKNYTTKSVDVFLDSNSGMKYAMWGDKRLYFKNDWRDSAIKRCLKNLLMEQDAKSPHRYLCDSFDLTEDDIVADIGCADGNFGLTIIDKVKYLYLFEVDDRWIESLKKTFEKWQHKVTIVNKMVSDKDDEDNISIDEFVKTNPITVIKGDLEGNEEIVLRGATNLLRSGSPLKIVLTTYHAQEHADKLRDILCESGLKCHYSPGYMILKNQGNLVAPYLRHGLIYAEKVSLT